MPEDKLNISQRTSHLPASVLKAMGEVYARSSLYGHTTREWKRKCEYRKIKAMYESNKRDKE